MIPSKEEFKKIYRDFVVSQLQDIHSFDSAFDSTFDDLELVADEVEDFWNLGSEAAMEAAQEIIDAIDADTAEVCRRLDNPA